MATNIVEVQLRRPCELKINLACNIPMLLSLAMASDVCMNLETQVKKVFFSANNLKSTYFAGLGIKMGNQPLNVLPEALTNWNFAFYGWIIWVLSWIACNCE